MAMKKKLFISVLSTAAAFAVLALLLNLSMQPFHLNGQSMDDVVSVDICRQNIDRIASLSAEDQKTLLLLLKKAKMLRFPYTGDGWDGTLGPMFQLEFENGESHFFSTVSGTPGYYTIDGSVTYQAGDPALVKEIENLWYDWYDTYF